MKSLKLSSLLALFALFLTMALLLAACGGGESAPAEESTGEETAAEASSGDAANGETLFLQTTIGSANAPGCVTCHSLEAGVVLVGPSMAGVATRAETMVEGLTAEEYLRQSIVEPNEFVNDGFVEGVMYQNFGTDLPAKSINDLTAYLLTLK